MKNSVSSSYRYKEWIMLTFAASAAEKNPACACYYVLHLLIIVFMRRESGKKIQI